MISFAMVDDSKFDLLKDLIAQYADGQISYSELWDNIDKFILIKQSCPVLGQRFDGSGAVPYNTTL